METGVEAIGLALPSLYVEVDTLAALRAVDPNKLRVGLGCRRVALAGPGEDAATLAVTAARRAVARWGGDPARIGLVVVGTESARDMSRPMAMSVMEGLGLRGAVRAYEVKHACYGGTLALRQAVEWRLSGAGRDRVALVVAADVARYRPGSAAEPTMGAGAVAMIVGAPTVAAIDVDSHAWSAPAWDFWRPAGAPYPEVDGRLSLDCYNEAVAETFRAWAGVDGVWGSLGDLRAACFHVPFPKMVRKAWAAMAEGEGVAPDEADALWSTKVQPHLEWNTETGNAYTASLWIAVACALRGARAGERLAAFSYGSGFGSELLTLRAGDLAEAGAWAEDVATDLAARRPVDAQAYEALRACDPAC